ncbi:MAG: hypothetical protein R3E53_08065 [Myxococcota bacterium]
MRHLLFHPAPEPLYLGVDDEPADEATVYGWLAKELGLPEPPLANEAVVRDDRRRSAGSKRCSNRRARESGYRFRYPTFREGYAALIQAGDEA